MRIEFIRIKNFRNFIDETIYFDKQSIIVGANDVGKTNLLYALRLLLDPNIPEINLKPSHLDFNTQTKSDRYDIFIKICAINEECIISKMKGSISEDGETFIKIIGTYDKKSGKRDYTLLCGSKEDKVEPIDTRYYIRVLNMRYIESARDLERYIKREKNWLLETTKESRTEEQVSEDEKTIEQMNKCLECISEQAAKLNFVKESTNEINDKLKSLSVHNRNKEVCFSTRETDAQLMVDRLYLAAAEDGQLFQLGGDGFSNQTHLSLWATRNRLEKTTPASQESASIYCIEEIEAHLHPHQQRKLSSFLNNFFDDEQVIITTHSPQIASHFPPSYITRLRHTAEGTKSFNSTTIPFKNKDAINFGYRMNAISAEIFFADTVFLVEGPSEKLLYEALAAACNIDINYYNISIIPVDGVGFAPYCDLAKTYGAKFVIRTDFDLSKIPKKEEYRPAGIYRGVSIAKSYYNEKISDELGVTNGEITSTSLEDFSATHHEKCNTIRKHLSKYNIYISTKDLEHDLILDAKFFKHAMQHFDTKTEEETIKKLQSKKATNMFDLLKSKSEHLKEIASEDISIPLWAAIASK